MQHINRRNKNNFKGNQKKSGLELNTIEHISVINGGTTFVSKIFSSTSKSINDNNNNNNSQYNIFIIIKISKIIINSSENGEISPPFTYDFISFHFFSLKNQKTMIDEKCVN